MRIWGCSIAALIVGTTPYAAHAQTTGAGQQQEQSPAIGVVPVPPTSPQSAARDAEQNMPAGGSAPSPAPEGGEAVAADDGGEIVVTGQLEGAVQGNPRPELQLDPAAIASYSATSVGELLDQISAQLGTDQPPVILLSGRRSSQAEVNRLPKEVIGRVDILSEDVALRLGYSANQKVVNIVLRRTQLLTDQFDAQAPTEGGVAGVRIRENLVSIASSRRRLILEAEYWETSSLFESERGVSRDSGSLAYDVRGNVVPVSGSEIDPALSAAAGTPVSVAGVPDAAAGGRQPLSAFAANANIANVTNNGFYRTLSGPQRNLDLNGSYARDISDTIDAGLTVSYTASQTRGSQGLPQLTSSTSGSTAFSPLRLPTGNPFSPFSRDVRVLRYYDDIGAMESNNRRQNVNIEGRLSGEGAFWADTNARWTIEGNFSRGTTQNRTERGVDASPFQALLTAGSPTANPFGVISPTALLLRPDDTTNSRNTNAGLTATMNGPLFELPAGNANLSVTLNGRTQRQTGQNVRNGILNPTNTSQDSASARASIDLPITSRNREVLGVLGDLTLNGNFQVEEVKFGRLTSSGLGFRWAPVEIVNASVFWSSDTNAPDANQLGDPITITPNVRAFDYVRGESVDITRIEGGNPNLTAQETNNFRINLNTRQLPVLKGQVNFTASYRNDRSRNGISFLPGITAEVEAAFPERFTRDATGRLTAIDARRINIASQSYEQVQFGFNFFRSLPSPSQQRMQEQRQRETAAFRAAMEESRRTGQPLPPEFTARAEEFRRQQQQQSIFGNRGGPGQNRGPGQGQGPGQNQAQGQNQGPGQAQAQGQNQGQGQNRGPGQGGQFGGGGRFGGGGFGGGGGGFGGRGGGGAGNGIRFNFQYIRVLKDERVIRPGLPVLDSLNGASGNRNVFNTSFGDSARWGLVGRGGFGRGGGTSRDNVQVTGAINYESYLLQLDTKWVSSTFVNTGALGSTTRLDYDAIAKVDLTTQINFDRQFNTVRRIPFLRGASVILNVDNVFNTRRSVTDQNGVTPTNQDPRLLDPIGRLVRMTFRKQFR